MAWGGLFAWSSKCRQSGPALRVLGWAYPIAVSAALSAELAQSQRSAYRRVGRDVEGSRKVAVSWHW